MSRLMLSVAVAVLMSFSGQAAEVTAERTDQGVAVKIDGQPFTEYLTLAGTKPVLWPILGPTGRPFTRGYPQTPPSSGKGGTKDHIHQRSLWFAHGGVNGVDFWLETPGKAGTIRHREFVQVESGREAVVVTRNDWLDLAGKKVCEDQRTLRFGGDAAARWIDFTIALKASEGPVEFTDTKEGSFGVRVADTMRVESKLGGRIVNSEGQTDAAAWSKPAPWVDYHGPVDGQKVGIAIMNHPGSFRYPTYWHVRTYGLFAANPFAQHDFGRSNKKAPYMLPQGETLMLRYRVLLHRGDEKEGRVAESFKAFAAE